MRLVHVSGSASLTMFTVLYSTHTPPTLPCHPLRQQKQHHPLLLSMPHSPNQYAQMIIFNGFRTRLFIGNGCWFGHIWFSQAPSANLILIPSSTPRPTKRKFNFQATFEAATWSTAQRGSAWLGCVDEKWPRAKTRSRLRKGRRRERVREKDREKGTERQ